jgi:hypothetical protein
MLLSRVTRVEEEEIPPPSLLALFPLIVELII